MDKKAQVVLEYTILFAVMIVALFFLSGLGNTLKDHFNNVVNAILGT